MMRKTLVLLAHGRSAWRGAIRGAALAAMLCGLATLPTSAGPRHPGKPLQIYFVDVEGGQSTLFVTPQGQSLLIDTGWPGNDGRDADRILAAARLAQIRRLDFVILTHYHQDHAGGIPQLAARIPIGTVLDHGANRETGAGITEKVFQDYQAVLADGKVKRVIARPGDIVPIQGIRVVVVSADGELLSKALPGAGKENPA